MTTSRCVCPFLTWPLSPSTFDHSSRRAARHLRSLNIFLQYQIPFNFHKHAPTMADTTPSPSPHANHKKSRRSKRDGECRMVGTWEIGRTIGRGSSGASSLSFAFTHRRARALTALQDASRLPNMSRRSNTLPLRSSPSRRLSPAVCP